MRLSSAAWCGLVWFGFLSKGSLHKNCLRVWLAAKVQRLTDFNLQEACAWGRVKGRLTTALPANLTVRSAAGAGRPPALETGSPQRHRRHGGGRAPGPGQHAGLGRRAEARSLQRQLR